MTQDDENEPRHHGHNLRSNHNHVVNSLADTQLTPNFACAIFDEETGKSLEFRQLMNSSKHRKIWMKSFANELGRLSQGIRDIPGTNTIDFIPFTEAKDKATYGRVVCMHRPHKDERNHARLTVGGNLLVALYDVSTPTSDLTTAKLLFNLVISTPGARFVTLDLKNFCLNTPLPKPRHMRMHPDLLPDEIIQKCNLNKTAHLGWVHVHIKKGMHGLPEAGILANKLLQQHLLKSRHHECQFTPGLHKHVWRPIMFSLAVDDFGVKCQGIQHAKHLKSALEQHCDVSADWKAESFCGTTLDWNCNMGHVDLSVPGHVQRKRTKHQHPDPKRPQHSPCPSAPIACGAKIQSPVPSDTSAKLSDKQIKHIQDIVGSFIWHRRACDPTLAATLSPIRSRQTNSTKNVMAACHQLPLCSDDVCVSFYEMRKWTGSLGNESILTLSVQLHPSNSRNKKQVSC